MLLKYILINRNIVYVTKHFGHKLLFYQKNLYFQIMHELVAKKSQNNCFRCKIVSNLLIL